MDTIVESLHALERKVLLLLPDHALMTTLVEKSKLQQVEVMRALQWLENKKIVTLTSISKEILALDENGSIYVERGLPERRLLKILSKGQLTLKKLMEMSGFDNQEFNISLGMLKGKAAITIEDGTVTITENGSKLLGKESLEEQLLHKIHAEKVLLSDLSDEERFAFDNIKKRRKIIKVQEIKDYEVRLTPLGTDLVKKGVSGADLIEKLTPEMICEGSWKERQFRRYDVSINVPRRLGGKKHPYNDFINTVKHILLRMGFIEMTGPIIESEFWNFDALYQPQNHPARTWSATYRIKEPKVGDLPEKKVMQAVKETHENGGTSGSKGWGTAWDPNIAMQLMPRAHDTAISPRYMVEGVKIPGKYFSLVRCYRPDVIDATHGVEFNQMGGFVVGKDLSFKHLLGLLQDCAFELTGAKEARFFPDYFPFTEPSVQISVKHPEFGWLELAGAGVFRPELCTPLGITDPVIAWGFGLERLAMLKLGIKDIRDLFSHDIEFLRSHAKYY